MDNSPVTDGPIHEYFELSYSSHLVISRTLLQSMPTKWQEHFTTLLRELDSAYAHLDHPEYQVTACTWKEAWELSEAEKKATKVTSSLDGLRIARSPENPTEEEFNAHEKAWQEAYDSEVFHDADGNEVDKYQRVAVPVPETIPHYQRGRTYIKPQLP